MIFAAHRWRKEGREREGLEKNAKVNFVLWLNFSHFASLVLSCFDFNSLYGTEMGNNCLAWKKIS